MRWLRLSALRKFPPEPGRVSACPSRATGRGPASSPGFIRFPRAVLLGGLLTGGLLFHPSAAAVLPPDSTAADSTQIRTNSPTVAVLKSAVLPGWGQWSNGQKIKAALVLGGGLGLIGNAYYQNRMALRSTSFDEGEFYRNNRSQSIWWFAGLYALNLADAYVDAELLSFDAGPNLSEGIDPALRGRLVICLNL